MTLPPSTLKKMNLRKTCTIPSPEKIVINTGSILALVAALGSLDVLSNLYKEVIVPYEVGQEIMAAGSSGFATKEFTEAAWPRKREQPVWPHPFLSNSLDVGEASVIQLALDEQIGTVCIDEAIGRRVARLNNLKLTGALSTYSYEPRRKDTLFC
jgi:predicted nucleic acid-binding protein